MNFTPEQLKELEAAKRLGLALSPEMQAIDNELNGGAKDLNVSQAFPELKGNTEAGLKALANARKPLFNPADLEVNPEGYSVAPKRTPLAPRLGDVPVLSSEVDVEEEHSNGTGAGVENAAVPTRKPVVPRPMTQEEAEFSKKATQDTSGDVVSSTSPASEEATKDTSYSLTDKTYTSTDKPSTQSAFVTKGPLNPIHELFKRDVLKQVQDSNLEVPKKEALLRAIGGMGSTDVYTKYMSGTTGLNNPAVNKPRDTTADTMRQGLVNSWNINRAYLGLSPVAAQKNPQKEERDDFREWLLKRGQLENQQARANRIGGAKSPANVQLNADIMQQRQLENKLTDLQTNKSKYINDFVRSNRDMPDAAQRAEELYEKAFNNVSTQLTTVRDRIKQQGGRDFGAVSLEAPVDIKLASQADAARLSEKDKKELQKKEEARLKALDKADSKALALYGDYKADPRVKSYNESEGFLNFADEQIATLKDPNATSEDRALAADSLIKGYERIQNSGTVLLSEKQAIQDSFGIIDKLKGLITGKVLGDTPLGEKQRDSFQNAINRARKASSIGKAKADAEFKRRANVLRIEPEVGEGLFGWSNSKPVESEEVVVTEPAAPKPVPAKPAPKAPQKTPAVERKTIGGKVYQKVNGKWEMVK